MFAAYSPPPEHVRSEDRMSPSYAGRSGAKRSAFSA